MTTIKHISISRPKLQIWDTGLYNTIFYCNKTNVILNTSFPLLILLILHLSINKAQCIRNNISDLLQTAVSRFKFCTGRLIKRVLIFAFSITLFNCASRAANNIYEYFRRIYGAFIAHLSMYVNEHVRLGQIGTAI